MMKKYSMTMLCSICFFIIIAAFNCNESFAAVSSGNSTYSDSELDALETLFVKAVSTKNTSVDYTSSGISSSELEDAYHDLNASCPEMFFVSSITYTSSKITISYRNYSASQITSMCKAFETESEKIIGGVQSSWTDLQKIVYVHDYMVANYSYDYESYLKYINTCNMNYVPDTDFYAIGIMTTKTGVCQGYSLAYKYILTKLGIECCMVTSKTMNHAWNVVKLNGKYYHVDLAWDDPVYDTAGKVSHEYFLLSDASIGSTEKGHEGWTGGYAATDTKYDDYFWQSTYSPIQFYNGGWYYVKNSTSGGAGLYSYDFSTGSATKMIDMNSARWYVPGSSNSYMPGCYSTFVIYNGELYYNLAKYIIIVNVKTYATEIVYTLPTSYQSLGYIYGIGQSDGKVVYHLKSSPSEAGTLYNATIKESTVSSLAATTQAPVATQKSAGSTQAPVATQKSAGSTQAPVATQKPASTTQAPVATQQPVVKPSKVTTFKQSAKTASTVTITWNAVSGATGYRLYKQYSTGYKAIGNFTARSYTDTGLKIGGSYKYIVRAYKDSTSNLSDNSAVLTAQTYTAGQAQVKGAKVKSYTTKSVTVSWNAISKVAGYQIWQYNSSTKKYAKIANTTSTSCTLSGLNTSVYRFKIRAYVKADNAYTYGNYSETLYVATKPSTPSSFRGSAVKGKKITLKWNKTSGASGYYIYRATSANGKYTKIATVSSSKSSYTNSNLTKNKKYYYKIVSYKKVGTKVYTSTMSGYKNIKASK